MKACKISEKTAAGERIHIWMSAKALLLAVILAAAGIFTACRGSSPRRLFIEAGKAAYEALQTKLKGLNEKTEKTVSTDLDISCEINSGNEDGGALIRELFEKSTLNLKINSQPDEKLIYAGINYNGNEILTGTFTQDKEGIGVYLPELDGSYYITKDFNSISAAVIGAVSVADSQDTYFEPVHNIEAAGKACLARYFIHTTACVSVDSVTLEKNPRCELSMLGSAAEKCSVLTFRPTEKALIKFFNGIAGELENDTDFALFLASAAERNPVLSAGIKKTLEKGNYTGSNNFERILAALNVLSEKLKENAEEYAKKAADGGFCIKFTLNSNFRLIKLTAAAENKEIFVCEANKKGNTDKIGMMYSGNSGIYKIIGEKTAVSKTVYAFNINCEAVGGASAAQSKMRINIKSDGLDFGQRSALGIPYGTVEYSAEGRVTGEILPKISDDICGKILEFKPLGGGEAAIAFTLAVGADERGGSRHEIVFGSGERAIKINIHSTDGPCTAQKPDESKKVDISEFTSEQLNEIKARFRNALSMLIMTLTAGSLFS